MTTLPKKITDLIKENQFSYSFEITPDVNKDELNVLETKPAFFSVTWHAKSHQCRDLNVPPLEIANFLVNKKQQVLLHLSCDHLKKSYLEKLLVFLQEIKICNLFLILGEGYDGSTSDFKNTVELIRYIRKITKDYFCIGVAGFCEFNKNKLIHLKDKIDAGADFIITQAFFEAEIYKKFKAKCFEVGINVPIVPGLFIFENYNQLTNFTNMCKVKMSDHILEYIKSRDKIDFSPNDFLGDMVKTIVRDFPSSHFHFFTLNKFHKAFDFIKIIEN